MEVIDPHRFATSAQAFDGFGNRSRSFNGSSDYVSIPDINESTTNLSVAFWVKTTDQDWTTTHLAHWRSLSNNRAWFIGPSRTAETNGKKLMVFLTGDGAGTNPAKRYYGTTDVSDGTWHHVAFTWDNGTLKLFVDGSEETTTKVFDHAMTTIHNSDGPITVGCTWVNDLPASFGSGGRADIRIYNSTLTATDISDIYNGKNITTNLAGQWLTDEDNLLDVAGSNNATNYGSKYSYDNPSPPVEFGSASRSFDGVSDRIEIADTNEHSFGDGVNDSPFSVSAWIKIEAINKAFRVLCKWSDSSGQEWAFTTDGSDRLALFLKDFSSSSLIKRYYSTSLSSYLNQWVHVSATYDGRGGDNAGDGIDLYLNGVNVDDSNGNSGFYTAMENKNTPTYIGAVQLTSGYSLAKGKMADVRLYDAELSSSDIASLYNGTNVTTNLIGHWLTDNDDVEDKAGTNDGTNYGSTYSYDNPPMDLIPSRQASRSFNGASDYVDLGDALDNVFAGTGKKFTITAWIKTTTLADTDPIAKYSTSSERSFLIRVLSDGNLAMVMSNDGSFNNTWGRQTDNAPISANAWHHISIAYDQTATGDYLRMWVNGTEDATLVDWLSGGTFTSIYDATSELRISGTTENGGLWGGKIADVRIYDTDLTTSQVLDIHNGTKDRTNLVGQWLTNSDDVIDHAGTNDGTNNGSTYSTDSPS